MPVVAVGAPRRRGVGVLQQIGRVIEQDPVVCSDCAHTGLCHYEVNMLQRQITISVLS